MKQKIFSHLSKAYETIHTENGAYLYSKEIVKYFIPNIKTTRNWVTIRKEPYCFYSQQFAHGILHLSEGLQGFGISLWRSGNVRKGKAFG